MAKPMGLYGPLPLTQDGVGKLNGVGPGAYALGKLGADNIFYIDYIGRSDDDLRGRLQQHVPEYYQQFMYAFFPSAKEAFAKECRLYHDFSPVNNRVHPARPRGESWTCPVCLVFG